MTEERTDNSEVNDYTHISVVLDRSGSMQSIADDTVGGFNAFLSDQKANDGRATITLVQFDNQYEVLKDMEDLEETEDLTRETYVPRGGTALLDAIGRTINTVDSQISALGEDEQPDKVVFVIITDGEENQSREFSRDNIFEMISRHESENDWQFVFIGANQDAIQAGGGMGVRAANSLTYGANAGGVRDAYLSVSRGLTSFRTSAVADAAEFNYFTAEDREAQEAHGIDVVDSAETEDTEDVEDTEGLAFHDPLTK